MGTAKRQNIVLQSSLPLGLCDDFGVLFWFLYNFVVKRVKSSENPYVKGFIYWSKVIGYGFLTALYIWSPIDLIPESMFGPYGYIDDLLVLYAFITKVCL
jgi:hypothetical protein